jgi:hypothetical protein
MKSFLFIIIFVFILFIIIIYFKNEYFDNINNINNIDNKNTDKYTLNFEIVYAQLKLLSQVPEIKKELITNDPSSLLTHQLLEGILLVDKTLQYYLIVSRGLLQIYHIGIEDDKIYIIKKITFNPQSNTYWNFHYGEILSNYIDKLHTFDWRLQNDGNLVLFDYEGLPFWQSNTFIDKYILSIDKFNLIMTKYNNKSDKKIINIDRIDSIQIPAVDKFEDITTSNHIFEYYINKINKIYNNEKLSMPIVTSPIVNEEYKKMKIKPIDNCTN